MAELLGGIVAPCSRRRVDWTMSYIKFGDVREPSQYNYWLSVTTRNTFCGTWYLPHSHVHN